MILPPYSFWDAPCVLQFMWSFYGAYYLEVKGDVLYKFNKYFGFVLQ